MMMAVTMPYGDNDCGGRLLDFNFQHSSGFLI